MATRQSYNSRSARMRARINAWLTEQTCEACGEDDADVLEFHHTEPGVGMARTRWVRLSWPRVLEEIAKCQVLCANDHKRAHARMKRGD